MNWLFKFGEFFPLHFVIIIIVFYCIICAVFYMQNKFFVETCSIQFSKYCAFCVFPDLIHSKAIIWTQHTLIYPGPELNQVKVCNNLIEK